jgi:hypothetical protein
MDRQTTANWVVVAQFLGTSADIDADVAVSALKGCRIPVQRLPVEPMVNLARGMLAATEPVRVLVPPDRAAEAKELLGRREAPPAEAQARVAALQRTALVRILQIVGLVLVAFGLMYFVSNGCHG